MKKHHCIFVPAAFVGSIMAASGQAVDLTTWDALGNGNWVVQSGNDSVLQTVNGNPTFFYEAGSLSQGQALSGNIRVNTTSDDDFIGFALGFDTSDFNSASADFILIDWKQNDQDVASRGLAISHVTNSTTAGDFWAHTGGVNEIARGNTLGDTGWSDLTDYTFDLQFTSNLIQVSVNDSLELSIVPADAGLTSFDDGSFAFYNYSQGNVLYSAVQESETTINEIPEVSSYGSLLALCLLPLTSRRRRSGR